MKSKFSEILTFKIRRKLCRMICYLELLSIMPQVRVVEFPGFSFEHEPDSDF